MIPKRLFLYILTLCSTLAYTQADWQWGISGGSFTAITGNEQIESIATDDEGNVFFVASVGLSNLALDGEPQDFYGDATDINQLIGSYDCAGNYRWSRTIGGGGGSGPKLNEILTDADGNVYISGRVIRTSSSANVVFGGIGFGAVADTILPHSSTSTNTFKQGLFIAKYNNEGEMLWLKFPQSEDTSFIQLAGSQPWAFEVDPVTGHSFLLTRLAQGLYGDGSFEVTSDAFLNYVLEYDTEGNFVSGTLMDFIINSSEITFKRNHQTGRFYLRGYVSSNGNPFVINGESIMGTFVAAFDANGNYLWKEHTTELFANIYNIFIDPEDDSIYITGGMGNNVTFFGITFSNPSSNNLASMLFKVSADGELIYGTYATGGLGRVPKAIAISGGEVALLSHSPTLVWQDFEVVPPATNSGDNVFIILFDKYTGIIQDLNVIESNFGNTEIATTLAADPFGNYYAGGRFSQFMYVGDDTLLNGSGSFDFFLAKYGTENCNCVLPTSSFEIEGAGTDFNFNFTGSTEGSTVTWDFGDDTSGDGFNPSHNYAVSGTYQVCATVTDACGSTQFCTTIEAVLSSNNPAFAEVSVYPNPATSQLNINTPEALQFEIFNVVGAKMQSGTLTAGITTWNVQHFATGIYYLNLTKTNGATTTLKWVKTE